jgi:hypothetical protein
MMITTTAALDDGAASRVTIANEGLHRLESALLAEARQRLVSRSGLVTGYRVIQVHRGFSGMLRVVGWSDAWIGEWIGRQGYGDGVLAEIAVVSRDQIASAIVIVASQIGANAGALVDPLILAVEECLAP